MTVPSSLETQLGILNSAFADRTPTFAEIQSYLLQLSDAQRVSVSEVCTVLKLILVMQATNAISEHSASALRRVKMYLRATISQVQLNNLLVLHAHKVKTDDLNIASCLNDFVQGSEHRLSVFGRF